MLGIVPSKYGTVFPAVLYFVLLEYSALMSMASGFAQGTGHFGPDTYSS